MTTQHSIIVNLPSGDTHTLAGTELIEYILYFLSAHITSADAARIAAEVDGQVFDAETNHPADTFRAVAIRIGAMPEPAPAPTKPFDPYSLAS